MFGELRSWIHTGISRILLRGHGFRQRAALWTFNLAHSLQVFSRAGDALSMYERALAVSERALGPDHPEVAIRLSNLTLGLSADFHTTFSTLALPAPGLVR